MQRIILASASPRRAELLRAAGIEFEVMPANVDESVHPSEAPDAYVRRVAEAKARALAARANGRIILAADTTVVVDGEILGKPLDDQDAKRMLRLLSGRSHDVLTAVALYRGPAGSAPLNPMFAPVETIAVERTEVDFAKLAEDEIEWYVATGEPRDKAGAYAIQGYGSRFVTRVDGSYSNVVGLPMSAVYAMLKDLAP